MTPIHFTKMHGLGNDFMVIDVISQTIDISRLPINTLADRHLGVGFDQLLVIERSKNADAFCRIYNADGSEAEQCGNGLRCVARYLHEQGIIASNTLALETIAGLFPVTIRDYEHICVTLGAPSIQNNLIDLALPSQTLPVSILATGNPHAIVKVAAVDNIPFENWGNEIAAHEYFPQGANVGFLQVINRRHARLRTLERGVGETNACGSNACAAAVAGIVNDWLDTHVQLEFRFGSLTIAWEGEGKPIQMTGPATLVFTGVINDYHTT